MNELSRDKSESKLICVGIVQNAAGQVLMMRHKAEETSADGKATLRWVFPGGFLKKGEEREDCVKKSFLERTGYEVEPKYPIDIRMNPEFPYIVAYYLCELASPEPIQKITHPDTAEITWVAPKDLDALVTSAINPKVREFLRI